MQLASSIYGSYNCAVDDSAAIIIYYAFHQHNNYAAADIDVILAQGHRPAGFSTLYVHHLLTISIIFNL